MPKWLLASTIAGVGDVRANFIGQNAAVLVAARREEGGGIVPRRPCDSSFLTPRACLYHFLVVVYGVHATRVAFVVAFLVGANVFLRHVCLS